MERGMSDDVERVARRLAQAIPETLGQRVYWNRLGVGEVLAPRVLAAIRAAATEAVTLTGTEGPAINRMILDAALAALTDHPGGTDNG